MKYCTEQEQVYTRFVSKASRKGTIIKLVPEINCLFFNDGNGLHTFLRRSTALVGVGVLIVEVPRPHSDILYKVRLLWTSDRSVAETSVLQHTQNPNKRPTF